jgi:hypothetical protein
VRPIRPEFMGLIGGAERMEWTHRRYPYVISAETDQERIE